MSDLVERLRNISVDYAVQEGGFTDEGWLLREAADRIEQQHAEIERLRAALQEIRSLNDGMDPDVEDIARRALEGK